MRYWGGESGPFEKAPLSPPKKHPYPPKIFERVGGGTGRLEKLNDGIRLPDLRYKEIQKACWLTLMVIDGEMPICLEAMESWTRGRCVVGRSLF